MYRVDKVKRAAVREEVGLVLGPSDPTIVISEPEGEAVDMQALVDSVKKFGDVVLVRLGLKHFVMCGRVIMCVCVCVGVS